MQWMATLSTIMEIALIIVFFNYKVKLIKLRKDRLRQSRKIFMQLIKFVASEHPSDEAQICVLVGHADSPCDKPPGAQLQV